MTLIVNPNSSVQVTAAIREACDRGAPAGSDWSVTQLDGAPAAIESDADVERATELMVEFVGRGIDAPTLIVACHSDPGVRRIRAALGPAGPRVLGIGETSMLVAAALGERFGVLSLHGEAIPRKRRMISRLGLAERCASVVATGTGVLDGVGDDLDVEPYARAAERAVDDGADVLVLGCAGMARLPGLLERRIGVPVVEPVAATIAVASSTTRGPRGREG